MRRATSHDAPALAGIYQEARAAAMPWLPVLHSPEEDVIFFRERVVACHRTMVAEDNHGPVAFINFSSDFVHQLYVRPKAWRQGLGTALLSEAKMGAETLALWVFQQNRAARAFYAAHGFEVDHFTDGENNEEKTPDMMMIWRASREAPSP